MITRHLCEGLGEGLRKQKAKPDGPFGGLASGMWVQLFLS